MSFLKKNLANGFTLLNMFLGFAGVINVLYHDEVTGCYLLMLAAVFDLLDGFVARMLKTTSTLGKQLDSFSDLVSFGLLPAVIIHSLLLRSHQTWVYVLTFYDVPVVSFFPFIILAATALRLARFNEDSSQDHYFKGLPCPANGLFIASLPLILRSDLYISGYNTIYLEKYIMNSWVLISISLILSILMISRIPLMNLKFSNLNIKKNYPRYILILSFLICCFFFYFLSIPIIISFYVFLSLIFKKKIITID